jgi:hypothetical protein
MKSFKLYSEENCRCVQCSVGALEKGLEKLDNHSYDSINNLMMNISKKSDITGKELHNQFVSKHGETPDDWIKKNSVPMKEDGVIPGAPTMSAGTGEIAGLGVGKDGEPGFNRKKKKSVTLFKSFFNRNPPKLA